MCSSIPQSFRVLLTDGQKLFLDGEEVFISFLRNSIRISSVKPVFPSVVVNRLAPKKVCLAQNGVFISSIPDGKVGTQSFCENWETFTLIDAEVLRKLAISIKNGAYLYGADRFLKSGEVGQRVDGGFTIGNWKFDFNATCPPEESEEGDLIIYDDTISFSMMSPYNPAAYYCAFGKYNVIRSMIQSVFSLFEIGKFEGEVFVITDWEDIPWPDMLMPYLDRIRIVQIGAFDFFDYTIARYRLMAIHDIKNYSPVMYIDSDIIVNNDIRDVFRSVMGLDKFCVSKEYDLEGPSEWYGGRHWEAATTKPDLPAFGINSGIFVFKNNEIARGILSLTEKSMLNTRRIMNTRHMHVTETLDQPNLNWAIMLRYEKEIDTSLLDASVMHAVSGNFADIPNVGFAHFNGGIGDFETRADLLESYVNYLVSVVS